MGSYFVKGVKFQFQPTNFLFGGVNSELFLHLQWSRNRWLFFFYRLFMAGYTSGWFLYAYISNYKVEDSYMLSNWSEGCMVVYFLSGLIVAIYALATRKQDHSNNPDKLPWYLIIHWILFTVASDAAFEISLIYGIVIAPTRTLERNLRPVTFHLHVVNSILFLIDIFVVAFPVRILHVVYTSLYGLLYTIFLVVLHLTNVNSAVYSVLNFADAPGIAAGWVVMAVVVIPIIFHVIVFCLFQLRSFIAKKTGHSEVMQGDAQVSIDSSVKTGNVNQAFAQSNI